MIMNSKRRILLLGTSFGGGYRMVAEAIASYLSDHHADAVETLSADLLARFAPSLNVLAKFAYQQPATFFPAGEGTLQDLCESLPDDPVAVELATGTCVAGLRSLVTEYAPDAVVSTFPLAGMVAAEASSGAGPLLVTVVPGYGAKSAWLHPATDMYFVACKEAREDLVVRGVPWQQVVVSGVPVRETFAREVDRKQARSAFAMADRFSALVTHAAGAAADVEEIAARIASIGVQVAIVAGDNERLLKRLESRSAQGDLLRVFGFVDDMRTMMGAVDVAVAKAGGLGVFETVAAGLPLILHGSVSGFESTNVDFLVNSGAALLARDSDDVVEKVRFLSTHSDRLAQMSVNAAAVGHPASTQVVCERVLAALRERDSQVGGS